MASTQFAFTNALIPRDRDTGVASLFAETWLPEAAGALDGRAVKRAAYNAVREGRAATILRKSSCARPAWLPGEILSLRDLRRWVSQHCTMLRNDDRRVAEVELCTDVADALKHAIQRIYQV